MEHQMKLQKSRYLMIIRVRKRINDRSVNVEQNVNKSLLNKHFALEIDESIDIGG